VAYIEERTAAVDEPAAAADGPPSLLDQRRLEDRRLLLRYHREGDLEARDELVVRFMPLARQLASRYRNAGEPQEDLVQVACLGLLKAVDRFEPDRGHAFTKYAVPTMLGELKRHFRDKGWAVHVPRTTQELALKVSEAVGVLPARLGRSPTPRDVAKEVGVPVEDVLEAMEAATAYEAASLDAPRPGGEDEDGGWSYGDSVAVEEHGYELVEISEALRGTVSALPARERTILRLRFEEDLTQAEIAERIGVSQMHVSRLLRRSLDRLAAASPLAA
jgi:RNA polymerase sigma-B factor